MIRTVSKPRRLVLPEAGFTPAAVDAVLDGPVRLALPTGWRKRVAASARAVARIVSDGLPVYGINTGFGKLAQTLIAREALAELQRNLVLSHSVGVGEPLPDRVVRLVLALKVASLARGHSGVRTRLVEALRALLNADALPVHPLARARSAPPATSRRSRT